MSYSIYVCDVETTGTDPKKHDVIEVCFWRLGEEEGKTWCLKAMNPETIEDKALHINKHKRDDILWKTEEGRERYRLPSDVLPEIEMWIMEDDTAAEDRVFIGQNPDFDYDFLLDLWTRNDSAEDFPFGTWMEYNGKYQNRRFVIDTIDIAKLFDVLIGKKRKAYNLGSLVKAFKVTKCAAHTAEGDVKMTKDLFGNMSEPIKELIVEKFSDCYLD